MTKEQVIAWAREAGFEPLGPDIEDWVCFTEEIERFASLVAEHVRNTEFKPDWNNYRQGFKDGVEEEREACAKVCEARYMGDNNREDMEARRCAEAIRQRGKT